MLEEFELDLTITLPDPNLEEIGKVYSIQMPVTETVFQYVVVGDRKDKSIKKWKYKQALGNWKV